MIPFIWFTYAGIVVSKLGPQEDENSLGKFQILLVDFIPIGTLALKSVSSCVLLSHDLGFFFPVIHLSLTV